MAYMNEDGLLVDNLMHVSKPIKDAVVLNKVLVKQKDKVVRSLERERILTLRQISHHQDELNQRLREKLHSPAENLPEQNGRKRGRTKNSASLT